MLRLLRLIPEHFQEAASAPGNGADMRRNTWSTTTMIAPCRYSESHLRSGNLRADGATLDEIRAADMNLGPKVPARSYKTDSETLAPRVGGTAWRDLVGVKPAGQRRFGIRGQGRVQAFSTLVFVVRACRRVASARHLQPAWAARCNVGKEFVSCPEYSKRRCIDALRSQGLFLQSCLHRLFVNIQRGYVRRLRLKVTVASAGSLFLARHKPLIPIEIEVDRLGIGPRPAQVEPGERHPDPAPPKEATASRNATAASRYSIASYAVMYHPPSTCLQRVPY